MPTKRKYSQKKQSSTEDTGRLLSQDSDDRALSLDGDRPDGGAEDDPTRGLLRNSPQRRRPSQECLLSREQASVELEETITGASAAVVIAPDDDLEQEQDCGSSRGELAERLRTPSGEFESRHRVRKAAAVASPAEAGGGDVADRAETRQGSRSPGVVSSGTATSGTSARSGKSPGKAFPHKVVYYQNRFITIPIDPRPAGGGGGGRGGGGGGGDTGGGGSSRSHNSGPHRSRHRESALTGAGGASGRRGGGGGAGRTPAGRPGPSSECGGSGAGAGGARSRDEPGGDGATPRPGKGAGSGGGRSRSGSGGTIHSSGGGGDSSVEQVAFNRQRHQQPQPEQAPGSSTGSDRGTAAAAAAAAERNRGRPHTDERSGAGRDAGNDGQHPHSPAAHCRHVTPHPPAAQAALALDDCSSDNVDDNELRTTPTAVATAAAAAAEAAAEEANEDGIHEEESSDEGDIDHEDGMSNDPRMMAPMPGPSGYGPVPGAPGFPVLAPHVGPPHARADPKPPPKPSKSSQVFSKISEILQDNRMKTADKETTDKLKDINQLEASNEMLKKVLNIVFVTTGMCLLVSVVIVIVYTSIGIPGSRPEDQMKLMEQEEPNGHAQQNHIVATTETTVEYIARDLEDIKAEANKIGDLYGKPDIPEFKLDSQGGVTKSDVSPVGEYPVHPDVVDPPTDRVFQYDLSGKHPKPYEVGDRSHRNRNREKEKQAPKEEKKEKYKFYPNPEIDIGDSEDTMDNMDPKDVPYLSEPRRYRYGDAGRHRRVPRRRDKT